MALTGQMISIIVHYCKYHRFTLIITHLLLLAQDLLIFRCFFLLAPILVLRFFRWEHSCHHMKELLLNSDAASKNKSSILLILLFIQLWEIDWRLLQIKWAPHRWLNPRVITRDKWSSFKIQTWLQFQKKRSKMPTWMTSSHPMKRSIISHQLVPQMYFSLLMRVFTRVSNLKRDSTSEKGSRASLTRNSASSSTSTKMMR